VALSTAGRYQSVKKNLKIKEIIVGDGEARKRYVLVRDPKQVIKDQGNRKEQLKRLAEEIKTAHADKCFCQ
jgi:hypothetical protein